MNCEAFRERLAEDPLRIDAELDRHAETCPACQAYRQRLLRAEAQIQKAVRFDVGGLGRGSATISQGTRARSGWVTLTSGMAAGLLVGVMIWSFLGGGRDLSSDALAGEVEAHWFHEPESWLASERPVSGALLADVLDGEAEIDLARLDTVSYAETCWVAGEWIPHLVVQSETGPYMVLLMPGRALDGPVPVQLPEEGLSGHIVPMGGGSIAVLGGGQSSDVQRMEEIVVAAVNWTI